MLVIFTTLCQKPSLTLKQPCSFLLPTSETFYNTSQTQKGFVHTNIRNCTVLGQGKHKTTKIKLSLEVFEWKTS